MSNLPKHQPHHPECTCAFCKATKGKLLEPPIDTEKAVAQIEREVELLMQVTRERTIAEMNAEVMQAVEEAEDERKLNAVTPLGMKQKRQPTRHLGEQ
jgi:hypothetical protein